MIGLVDALGRTPLTAEQCEIVGLIRDSGTILERLVSDLLDVAKIEAEQLKLEQTPFDLEDALRPAIEVMRYRAEAKGLTFEVERGKDARGRFVGDGTRVGQIVSNLLSNAVKFTEVGGVKLRITVEEDVAGAWLGLVVEDTGIGFDAEQGRRLFERFTQADATTSRRFGGTGLGLSICRSLTQMMGGDISASSAPGVGSRFEASVRLPRAETLRVYDAREPKSAALPEMARQGPLRVLLAEDHPTNRRVVEIILAGQGANLTAVDDGLEAVAAFAPGAFDVVLMDMQMPRMDGLAATRAIRLMERQSGAAPTPIIMLTANAMPEHHADSLAAGANLHLAKPITAAGLLLGIQAALETELAA